MGTIKMITVRPMTCIWIAWVCKQLPINPSKQFTKRNLKLSQQSHLSMPTLPWPVASRPDQCEKTVRGIPLVLWRSLLCGKPMISLLHIQDGNETKIPCLIRPSEIVRVSLYNADLHCDPGQCTSHSHGGCLRRWITTKCPGPPNGDINLSRVSRKGNEPNMSFVQPA